MFYLHGFLPGGSKIFYDGQGVFRSGGGVVNVKKYEILLMIGLNNVVPK